MGPKPVQAYLVYLRLGIVQSQTVSFANMGYAIGLINFFKHARLPLLLAAAGNLPSQVTVETAKTCAASTTFISHA